MAHFKQGIHVGLVLSTLLLCTLLLYSYHAYLKLPVSNFQMRGASSKLVQSMHDIAKAKLRDTDNRNQTNTISSDEIAEEHHCTPRRNIVFFKMHKCSSSTVQNILFRYGEEHKLDFVLPKEGNYLGNGQYLFVRSLMMKFPVKKYNVLCHHTRFNYRGMAEVMHSDAVYTTIIRDPISMFESLFTYGNFALAYNLPEDKALELFLEKPEYYYAIAHTAGKLRVRNPMLYDLGLEDRSLGDPLRIKRKIHQMEYQFDLVMITEYFDESLILLRDLFCWEMDDIVYFVLNARNKSSVRAVSPKTADNIRRWNFGDVQLYDAFNRTFWKKVEAFGHDRMQREVAELRKRKAYFKEHCIADVVSGDEGVWRPPGIDIDSFKLKPEASKNKTCVRMIQTELPYSDHIRKIQVQRYFKSANQRD
ncbi:galactosylceramide sulfotransferase-like [Patiria miniata]|uniref:Galactosylceramide sulfotransferase n=1 Tax=Patiria miniata TaxID=46514 RepID=A0A914B6P6_PATMI|nr:galactosylceramide sulfotransferase-like [Patiria miniata]